MHILFDEAGKLLTGRLLSEAESSLQVELETGKRVKVKTANALLRFEKPSPSQLMSSAQALAADMELPLAYEFAPEDEFGFADLAREYYSASAGISEQVAALLCLQGAPHYFRRAGKGRYKKAPPEILAQALAAIEKKQQVQAQIEAWSAGRLASAEHQADRRSWRGSLEALGHRVADERTESGNPEVAEDQAAGSAGSGDLGVAAGLLAVGAAERTAKIEVAGCSPDRNTPPTDPQTGWVARSEFRCCLARSGLQFGQKEYGNGRAHSTGLCSTSAVEERSRSGPQSGSEISD